MIEFARAFFNLEHPVVTVDLPADWFSTTPVLPRPVELAHRTIAVHTAAG